MKHSDLISSFFLNILYNLVCCEATDLFVIKTDKMNLGHCLVKIHIYSSGSGPQNSRENLCKWCKWEAEYCKAAVHYWMSQLAVLIIHKVAVWAGCGMMQSSFICISRDISWASCSHISLPPTVCINMWLLRWSISHFRCFGFLSADFQPWMLICPSIPSASYYMHPLMKQEWNYCLLYQRGSEDCPA